MYIQSVETFFNLFSSEPLSSSSSQTFKQEWRREGGGRFGSLKQINNKVGLVDYSLAEAAFNLLQWAQYGEAIPKFHRPDEDSSSDKVTDENISLEEAGVVISEQTRNEGQAEVDDDDSDGDNELNILDEEEFNAEAETVDSDGATQDNLSLARSVFDQEVEGEGPATGAEINILKKNADHSSVLHETDDPKGLQNGIVLRNYQRQALHWMMERETNANDRENVSKELKLLVELLKEEKSSTSWDSHSSTTNTASCSMEMSGESIQCTCGPVVVSQEEVAKSRTIDGVVNPVHHPLWQCRFLTNPSMNYTICFYVSIKN